jgi:uncharacterized protein (TIGR00296 family)
MLSLDEGEKAVKFARSILETTVTGDKTTEFDLEAVFDQELGVFTTIHIYPSYDLRGCIGIPQPIMSLKKAIIEAARSTTSDPRFPPLGRDELDNIIVEVTILTKPEIIDVEKPEDYPKNIEIGRDGLIVEQGFYKGLLLPQVPVEQNWDKEEFLSHTCMKAGLMPDAWFDDKTKIYKFSGQIFTEIEPRGKIKEKNLDGSDS